MNISTRMVDDDHDAKDDEDAEEDDDEDVNDDKNFYLGVSVAQE